MTTLSITNKRDAGNAQTSLSAAHTALRDNADTVPGAPFVGERLLLNRRPAVPGDRRINSKGYIEVKLATDDFFKPMADVRGYVLEHRLVVAQHLKRCLWRTEIVDHRNHVRTDNALINLRLYETRNAHDSHHAQNREYKRSEKGTFAGIVNV